MDKNLLSSHKMQGKGFKTSVRVGKTPIEAAAGWSEDLATELSQGHPAAELNTDLSLF